MMTSALVLIAAILLLGGLLAALGDYLGTKVGKARLRIFQLRPRQTATFITIFTGTLIAASTLGILFATSESLRKGIFRLDEYLNRLQDTREELAKAIQEKENVQQELAKAVQQKESVQQELTQAQKRLENVNQKYQSAQKKLTAISNKVEQLNQQLSSLEKERQKLLQQRKKLEQQIRQKDKELEAEKQQLQASKERLEELEKQRSQLKKEIDQQDQKIAELDNIIKKRDEVLNFQEKKVDKLEKKIKELQNKIQNLEQYYQNYQALRQGNVALRKGEVLASKVVKIQNQEQTDKIVNRILNQANREAIKATQPGTEDFNKQVIVINKSQVQRLKEILKTGQEYVVQIATAGNYLSGEKKIRVFPDLAPNKKIFEKGEVIASLSLTPKEVQQGKLSERIDLLLASARFRARRSGMVGEISLEKDELATIQFMEQLASLDRSYNEINAIAAKPAYTAGPLQLKLQVKKNDQVILTN
ncbi:MAG: DUF3084 domain-containing protein [Cyanobacteria bacterium SW_9_44_58]|nr:MAG: DUF3084 domain-containing protein [Cyanobacteria bacterium SW_9_44_58]